MSDQTSRKPAPPTTATTPTTPTTPSPTTRPSTGPDAGSAVNRIAGSGRHVPMWVLASSLLLTLAGLGASSYLTVAHYNTKVVLACPSTGTINCEKVTTSPESVAFGIPVAVLGLAFFVGMLVLNIPWTWWLRWPLVHRVRLLAVAAGVCFVVWLIYAELFRIDAICLWCTSVHVITVALFAVVLLGTASTQDEQPEVDRDGSQG